MVLVFVIFPPRPLFGDAPRPPPSAGLGELGRFPGRVRIASSKAKSSEAAVQPLKAAGSEAPGASAPVEPSLSTALSALAKEPGEDTAPPMVKIVGHCAGKTSCQSIRLGILLGGGGDWESCGGRVRLPVGLEDLVRRGEGLFLEPDPF